MLEELMTEWDETQLVFRGLDGSRRKQQTIRIEIVKDYVEP